MGREDGARGGVWVWAERMEREGVFHKGERGRGRKVGCGMEPATVLQRRAPVQSPVVSLMRPPENT